MSLDHIDHIVVLILENRSFDHMLGYLKRESGRQDVDGLTGNEVNFLDDTPFPSHHDSAPKMNGDPVMIGIVFQNNSTTTMAVLSPTTRPGCRVTRKLSWVITMPLTYRFSTTSPVNSQFVIAGSARFLVQLNQTAPIHSPGPRIASK